MLWQIKGKTQQSACGAPPIENGKFRRALRVSFRDELYSNLVTSTVRSKEKKDEERNIGTKRIFRRQSEKSAGGQREREKERERNKKERKRSS